jgi:uncharacterized protein (TIGR02145 family)
MKPKALLGFLFTLSCIISVSQVPTGFNYQAIARNETGNPIVNTTLPVTITIKSDSVGGTIYWEELHPTVATNNFGLLTLVIGKGARQTASTVPTFYDINWNQTPIFIKTQIFYQSQLLDMGTARLWSVPYAMVAGDLDGSVEKLEVAGKTTNMEEALFEVKNKDGKTVFAVYNEGVRIYVGDGLDSKGVKGGFAVGGFDMTKGSQDYFVVNSDSIRAYIDTNAGKAKKGGFAVGGFDATKGPGAEYLRVTTDSVKVSKSLLIPRLTTTERDNLPFTPGEALIIFNMTESCMQIYKNNVWSNIWCFNCSPDFIFQPADKTICSGENAEFSISATGTSLSYQWQESSDNGSSWHNIYNGGTNPVYSGCNHYTLSLSNIPVSRHNFKYRCVVAGSCLPDVVSNIATLNVGSAPPVISVQPANQQLSGSCTASFSVVSPGYGVTYKWQESTNGGTTWNNISNGGSSPVYSGATTANLLLSNVGFTSNNFKYRCIAGNSCGADVTSNAATLTIAPTSIVTQPVNTQLTTDCSASFSITVPAGYIVSYKWQVSTNGGSSWNDISNGGTNPAYSGVTASVLTLSNVPKSFENYQYHCIVNSLCGPNETSGAAILSLNATPMITVQPLDKLVYTGQNIIFSITTSGSNISYQWQESTNGGGTWSNITDGGTDPAYSGAPSANLKLTKVPVTFNNYKYRCIVSHYCRADEVSNAVTLSVGTAVPVTDIDGTTYNSVGIGSQLWMAENLKVTKYGNGDLIETTTPATKVITTETDPKYQWAYNGDEANVAMYGRLYTWYALTDSRNVCPTGWHLPSANEWDILVNYLVDNGYCFGLGPKDVAKSLASTSQWQDCPAVGTPGNDQTSNNSSGFNGFPAGARVHSGTFSHINYVAGWWTSTIAAGTSSWTRSVVDVYGIVIDYDTQYRMNGNSVRCVKD